MMATVVLHVPDISCDHCGQVNTKALRALPGVQGVSVDVPGKRVRVTYDERHLDVERMKRALEDEEYPVAAVLPLAGDERL